MENWVASMRRLSSDWARLNSSRDSHCSILGNSSAGRVDREKRLRPERSSNLSPSCCTLISADSGKPRQISSSLRAGTVVRPGAVNPSSATLPIISTSRSVPVMERRSSLTSSSTLERIGRVGRPPREPDTSCRGRNSVSRLMANCMAWLRYQDERVRIRLE